MAKGSKGLVRRVVLLMFAAGVVTIFVVRFISLTVEYTQMKRENAQVEVEIKEQEKVEEDLKTTIDKLNDPDYLKSYAKENYLYSENGTIIIRIPDEEKEEEE